MENEMDRSAISFTAELLQKCLKGNFHLYSLEWNKRLLDEIENFQLIIFDRSQMYGDPNYRKRLLEIELSKISKELRITMAKQLMEKKFEKSDYLEEIFEFFDYASCLSTMGQASLRLYVRRESIGDDLEKELRNYFAEIILAKRDSKKRKKLFLLKVKEHYNWSNPIYQRIERILENQEVK